jgi:hypothetical protein
MSIAETIAGLPGDVCISGFVLDGTGSTVDEIRAECVERRARSRLLLEPHR